MWQTLIEGTAVVLAVYICTLVWVYLPDMWRVITLVGYLAIFVMAILWKLIEWSM